VLTRCILRAYGADECRRIFCDQAGEIPASIALIDNGAVPLEVLENQIDRWIVRPERKHRTDVPEIRKVLGHLVLCCVPRIIAVKGWSNWRWGIRQRPCITTTSGAASH